MKLEASSIGALIDAARHSQLHLLTAVDVIEDVAFAQPSLLPGWSRSHVVAHLVGNANGQRRMLAAARSGDIADQYPGGARGRAAEIDLLAGMDATQLRATLHDACDSLVEVWASMPDDAWTRPTNSLIGQRSAWVSVWARWREVEIHHVDLDIGYSSGEWTPEFVAACAGRLFGPDGLQQLARRLPDNTAVALLLSDGRRFCAGPPEVQPTLIAGPDHAIVAWVLGRPTAGLRSIIDDARAPLPRLAPFA